MAAGQPGPAAGPGAAGTAGTGAGRRACRTLRAPGRATRRPRVRHRAGPHDPRVLEGGSAARPAARVFGRRLQEDRR
ncbi:hypothetical protein G6F31_018683 [Rhizopus arrhizus]|nr:hypothetical protein G6F31_018683 [Rhizopus arrhizus]